jgi:hypothetical protein
MSKLLNYAIFTNCLHVKTVRIIKVCKYANGKNAEN